MRQVERINSKAYQGLTSVGIAHQIASSLRCFHAYKGTANDCQLTINPLVRAYHNLIMKERHIDLPATPLAKRAKSEKRARVREHVIPAHEVVCRLMDINPLAEDFNESVKETLEQTFSVAWVLKDEHRKLNRKHMHCLPVKLGATVQELAVLRYQECGVPVPTFD